MSQDLQGSNWGEIRTISVGAIKSEWPWVLDLKNSFAVQVVSNSLVSRKLEENQIKLNQ